MGGQADLWGLGGCITLWIGLESIIYEKLNKACFEICVLSGFLFLYVEK